MHRQWLIFKHLFIEHYLKMWRLHFGGNKHYYLHDGWQLNADVLRPGHVWMWQAVHMKCYLLLYTSWQLSLDKRRIIIVFK